MADSCLVCGRTIYSDRLVLVRGKRYWAYCSESCLRENLRKQRIAKVASRGRAVVASSLIALLLAGAGVLWKRYRAPQPEVIVSGPHEVIVEPVLPGPIYFGPAWPPTDADWVTAFNEASWIYPLPGPVRRACTIDGRMFGPDPPINHPAPMCRIAGHCGVDLGGDLWGEHVYAVHDGVVDRLQGSGNDERGGQYVRISHFGGMVFTQYFHLAAIPKGIARGVRIKAGDLIGLLGDTGIKGSRRHLHFALSIRPSIEFSELYWDPMPWMARWPLRVPPRGTVAGLTFDEREAKAARRRRSK